MFRSLIRRKKALIPLAASALAAGTLRSYSDSSTTVDSTNRNVAYAVSRIANLVYCVTRICINYGVYLKLKRPLTGAQSEEHQHLEKELTRLQDLEKEITIKHSSTKYKDWADYKVEIEKVKGDMSKITERMVELKEKGLNEVHKKSAELLRDLCMKNKGVYIKLGQHLCQLDYIFPEEYTVILRDLLDKNPISSYDEVCSVFQSEFGGALPTDLFQSFDRVPIASASLAQVHVAVGKDGRKYAVKVQHHYLKEDAIGDLVAVSHAIDCVAKLFENFQYKWLVREMNRNLPLELDFL